MTAALSHLWAIVRKDLLIDWRRKENWLAMFFFALLTLTIFFFAAGALQQTRYRLTAGGLEQLADRGWSAAKLEALQVVRGRTFANQADFLAAVAEVGGVALEPARRIALLQVARGTLMQDVAAGFLWITFLLAGVLGLDKSFGQERENGCMDGLLLTPVSRGTLYLGKMAANALFLVGILALLAPLYSLIFDLKLWQVLPPLAGVALAGVIGFSALGTLLGGVVSSLRGKEVLLPLLLFPLLVPVLIGVVQLTTAVLAGQALGPHAHWLRLVLAFDVVYLIVSYLVFEFVMEG